MANKTISDLRELSTVSNSNVLVVETNAETFKVTKENLLKEVNEELNTKSNINHTHDEYVTESELNAKGLATETFVESEISKIELTPGPQGPKGPKGDKGDPGTTTWEGITNKPTNLATETYVNQKIAEAQLNGGDVDLSSYATKDELNTKADLTHTHTSDEIFNLSAVATTGDYNDLINTPTIPNEYILPIASATTLGGIKVGSGLSIDRNGVLSATGTGGTDTGGAGTGGTAGNGIIFNDSYATDCNSWLTNGYIKTGTSTLNLPTLCTGVDKWGVLFFIAENTTNGTGTQMYFPADGTYKGRVFTRSLTAMNQSGGRASEWVLLTIQSDIPTLLSQLTNDSGFIKASELSPVALSGNYNDLINKPTIPTVPTNVSSFTNDAGYLTSIPSEYVTETELNDAISGLGGGTGNVSSDVIRSIMVVDALPEVELEGVLYLVKEEEGV